MLSRCNSLFQELAYQANQENKRCSSSLPKLANLKSLTELWTSKSQQVKNQIDQLPGFPAAHTPASPDFHGLWCSFAKTWHIFWSKIWWTGCFSKAEEPNYIPRPTGGTNVGETLQSSKCAASKLSMQCVAFHCISMLGFESQNEPFYWWSEPPAGIHWVKFPVISLLKSAKKAKTISDRRQ